MANQNVTQLTQQTVAADTSSVFYAVTGGTTDTGLPFSVLVNNIGLTGVPTVPTASQATNTTQAASTAYVQTNMALKAGLGANTYTGTQAVGASNPAFLLNDTGSTTFPQIIYQSNSSNRWALVGDNSAGAFTLNRYVSGSFTDKPISISNSTGLVTILSASIGALTATGTLTGFPGRLLNVQVISATGTYTPTTGTNKVIVELQAAGGGGGGSAATSTGQSSCGGGGSAGAYAKVLFTSGFSGVTVTIGAAGGAGAIGTVGGTATASSFGGLISCPGGIGGAAGVAVSAVTLFGNGAPAAVATISGGTTLANPGGNSGAAFGIVTQPGTASTSGYGANSPMGAGGQARGSLNAGIAGTGFGSGGGGGNTPTASGAGQTGAAGQPGVCVIYEYS